MGEIRFALPQLVIKVGKPKHHFFIIGLTRNSEIANIKEIIVFSLHVLLLKST